MENRASDKQYASSHTTKDSIPNQNEEIDPNLEYFHLFQTLQKDSLVLYEYFCNNSQRQKRLSARIKALANKANTFKDVIRPEKSHKKKYVRRGFDEIHKQFVCPFPTCKLSYGSKSSYRTHLRLKHPEQYCSWRYSRSEKMQEG